MVIYTNGEIQPKDAPLPSEDTPAVYFIDIRELPAAAEQLGMNGILLSGMDESASNRFESHNGYDCILLNIPDASGDVEAPPLSIDIYYTPTRLVFVHDASPIIERLKGMLAHKTDDAPLEDERILHAFFNLLTEKDASHLEDMEEEIANLEDMIAADRREDYIEKISILRRKLLKRKRYYESLYEALMDLEENQNGFLNKSQLASFHILTNRADRLLRSVLNLRDYVTQVRESYQSQIDISLNQTMKLFTVVTTIFLPLSLIAGWYGMNLQMPELGWPYTYPFVIGLCVLVVGGCLAYFKRKHWF